MSSCLIRNPSTQHYARSDVAVQHGVIRFHSDLGPIQPLLIISSLRVVNVVTSVDDLLSEKDTVDAMKVRKRLQETPKKVEELRNLAEHEPIGPREEW